MDIANFNNINIAAGKAAGDAMIRNVWEILSQELHSDEIAGHVQEDLFIIFLNSEEKEVLVERLGRISTRINRLAKELQVKGIHSRYGIYSMQVNE